MQNKGTFGRVLIIFLTLILAFSALGVITSAGDTLEDIKNTLSSSSSGDLESSSPSGSVDVVDEEGWTTVLSGQIGYAESILVDSDGYFVLDFEVSNTLGIDVYVDGYSEALGVAVKVEDVKYLYGQAQGDELVYTEITDEALKSCVGFRLTCEDGSGFWNGDTPNWDGTEYFTYGFTGFATTIASYKRMSTINIGVDAAYSERGGQLPLRVLVKGLKVKLITE